MRVAYVQDWLTVNGGAEKVTKEIMALYPNADVFSLIDYLSPEDRETMLGGKRATVSFIQKLPFSHRYYRAYLPLFRFAIERFDLREYDLIISSSYAVAKNVLTHADQRHICYCHSPMRYAWDLHQAYLDEVKDATGISQAFMRYFLSHLRIWDVVSSNRVDHFVANSTNVARRISKIYRRESTVVHPPVNIEEFELKEAKDDFYLTASRLVPYKRIDLIVQAFKQMPDKYLHVVGSGPELKRIKKMAAASPNIRVMGQVAFDTLKTEMSNAKAFIMAAHEDFGIAPIEAQACGTPVIAYRRGGILETTQEGKSAVYFNEQSSLAIKSAIDTFESSNLASPVDIREAVLHFNAVTFRKKFQEEVAKCLSI